MIDKREVLEPYIKFYAGNIEIYVLNEDEFTVWFKSGNMRFEPKEITKELAEILRKEFNVPIKHPKISSGDWGKSFDNGEKNCIDDLKNALKLIYGGKE